jgi:protein-S-isoprenylcysteine O-methyltransferase Ste14
MALALERRWPWRLIPEAAGLERGREPLGLILVAAALALLATAIGTFWRARTTILPNRGATFLALGGPYRWTRNPMYVGMTLLYLGLTVLVDSAWPLLPLPFVVLVIDRFVIAREERHLVERFGADYDAYRRRVRRWL